MLFRNPGRWPEIGGFGGAAAAQQTPPQLAYVQPCRDQPNALTQHYERLRALGPLTNGLPRR